MKSDFLKKLKLVLAQVYKNKQKFYYQKYSSEGLGKTDITKINEESFSKFPVINLGDLAAVPFENRCYQNKVGFNKLIFSKDTDSYLLIRRSMEEIKNDSFPINGSRPAVIMQDMYESIEKCLFFYEQGILPLIGEVLNPSVVYATLKQYQVDNIFMDCVSVNNFWDEIYKLKLPLKSITVIDSSFENISLKKVKDIELKFIICLPEFGRIAYSCKEKNPSGKATFHPYKDVLVEILESVVLTSVRLQTCPMIRYKSDLLMKEIKSSCKCNEQSFTLV
jgi:hypothetical protein